MLDRAEYAMTSMQDVRRLIGEHGWAVLVVGSCGGLRAAHVPCPSSRRSPSTPDEYVQRVQVG
jgi:hypothetical protein